MTKEEFKNLSDDTKMWAFRRYQIELNLIKSFLTDPSYEMFGSDYDHETEITRLANDAQHDRKTLTKQVESLTNEVSSLKEELVLLKSEKSKYKAKEYQYIHEERLNPPAYIPSSEEISLAKARYAFENEIWEIVYYLKMYIQSLNGKEPTFPYTKDMVEKQAHQAIKDWDEALSKWNDDNELWDCFINPEWFQTVYVDNLSDFHGGDCTAFPSSCMRCHCEAMFKIPYTATWGKSEGYKMEQAFLKDVKEKREQKESQDKLNSIDLENKN